MNSPIPPNNRGLLTVYSFGVGKIKNGLILQNIPCIFLSFDNVELNVINNVAARSKRKNNCWGLFYFSIYDPPNNPGINLHPGRVPPAEGWGAGWPAFISLSM